MHKVLVSEDSIIVNQHICKTLEVAGYDVYSAFTGQEAIEKSTEVEPDLILMDIMMETQDDGIQAAMQIKQESDVPIIFLTALTDDGTLDRVKNSEPHGYIVKPFNEIELLSNIKVAIHKARAENAVKNNRDLFQASINSIDQSFFLLDEEGSIFYLNKPAEELLATSFKDALGKEISSVLPLYDDSGAHLSLTGFKGLASNSELEFRSKNKTIPIGDVVVKEVEVRNSKHVLITLRDITDRVNARNLHSEMEHRRIASLIEGQENERNRLSREIHDGVGQLINLLKLNVKGLSDNEEKQKLESIIEQTLKEIRNVTENLHPSRLNDFTLEKNVEKLLDQIDDISEINFQFGSSDLPSLNSYFKTHLYRIIQEALSNILKHSQAKNATIQLLGMKKEIQLTIEDDGIGYDPNLITGTDPHHGLENIEYRVHSMNGKFTLDSNKESGTMLLITIPIPDGN